MNLLFLVGLNMSPFVGTIDQHHWRDQISNLLVVLKYLVRPNINLLPPNTNLLVVQKYLVRPNTNLLVVQKYLLPPNTNLLVVLKDLLPPNTNL
jgi:hypothetical protein